MMMRRRQYHAVLISNSWTSSKRMDHTGLSFGMLLVSTFRIMLERTGPPFLSERYSAVKVCENLGNIRITRHLCRLSTEEITYASEDAMVNCRA